MVATVSQDDMIPPEHVLDDRFGKNNLPDPRLCRSRDVDNNVKRIVDLFMSIVFRVGSDLLLQSDVSGLMINDVDSCYRIW